MRARISCTPLLAGLLVLASCGSDRVYETTNAGFQNDPDTAAIVNPSGGQLTVAYDKPDLQAVVNAGYIANEWEHMQLCLGVEAAAPIVLVLEGWLDTVDSDDVLFSFEGRRLATTSRNATGADLIRISTFDFDGSQGNPGFHLRSILGRYIWSSNQLLASGYNTLCASRL